MKNVYELVYIYYIYMHKLVYNKDEGTKTIFPLNQRTRILGPD